MWTCAYPDNPPNQHQCRPQDQQMWKVAAKDQGVECPEHNIGCASEPPLNTLLADNNMQTEYYGRKIYPDKFHAKELISKNTQHILKYHNQAL